MAVCPNCGGNDVTFHREMAEMSFNTRRVLKEDRHRIIYRTVGVCKNCGYTWGTEDTERSCWWYLFLLAVLPISLSVWFWRTTLFRLDKKWRAAILAVIWLVLVILVSCMPRSKPELSTGSSSSSAESNSVWASSYASLNDFEYYIDKNEIYIKDYKGRSKKVRINSTYDIEGTAMNVVSFDATFTLESVTSVIIPDGTRTMSDNMFNSCGVKYVYLPASLTEFDGWTYFHHVEKIYYGGTEEQWSALCTIERARLEVVQIVCNANPNDLK